ncbi:hypothetical protein FVB9532_03259 [Mesonia oceanica]|uniref:Uncharacterized protein n=2 Tax=Flavobacteriaceae TaxID=49546 RepID=A0AC61YBX8_9FLAO|nr:hypothetical protein FVB9532_03259 [Mesonia oceanica]|tara:strand:- start:116449 stop:118470 length:2022 start_codon:yes stop_codon:yes gene_type:complete
MFIFVLQGIWLHISELAGKDLDYGVIGKFLLYLTPSLIPLVLPLTILVSSIMVFGSFAENYEFAAMKSSGISLQRAMRSLIVFIGFLSITALFFANTVIPWAEFKSINLRYNIRELKPAMAIVEGAFNEIGNVNIKVGEKYGKDGEKFKDVIIHKKTPKKLGNYTVIKAESGELVSTNDNGLALILYNGNYYDELQPKDYKERKKKPFLKSYFDKYNINIDLSNFNDVDLDETKYNYSYKMLDIPELNESLDSLSQDLNRDKKNFSRNILVRSGSRRLGEDTLSQNKKKTPMGKRIESFKKVEDTITYDINTIEEFFDSYDANKKQQIVNIALGAVRGTVSNINGKEGIFKSKASRLNKTEIQLHEKYALAVACFILFFVGAPLGAIIRKGGMGLPMVIAILLFLTYHFIGIFAKNSAENGTISPFIASWLSTFIMLPLGVYLTYRATTDQGFINTDFITEPIRNFFLKIGLGKKKKVLSNFQTIKDLNQKISVDKEDVEKLKAYSDEKLIDIVKNYKAYNFSEDYRIAVLRILNTRGVTQIELKKAGNLYNKEYIELEVLLSNISNLFLTTNTLFILLYIFPIIIAILNNNVDSDILIITFLVIALINLILFYVSLFRLDKRLNRINQITGNENNLPMYSFLFLGPVFYFFFYFQYKNQIKALKRDLSSKTN